MTESSEPDDLTNDDDAGDNDEPEVFTHCWQCDEPLDEPTRNEDESVHPDCDPDQPPTYLMGALAAGGTTVDPEQAEGYCTLKDLACDALETVLEWEADYGEVFISLPDGDVVEARAWIERPENLALAGGRDRYAGRAEFDPDAPQRCWVGRTLPSGKIARPQARSCDDIAELAATVCEDVFDYGWMDRYPYTVMLPGGELADAADWAMRPETRRLAGCTTVRNRVRFRARGTCASCGAALSTVCTRILQGIVGEPHRTAVALHCENCDKYLPVTFVSIVLVDDASALKDAAPRLIGDLG